MRSMADSGLIFKFHSLRMSTGAQQENSANPRFLCDVISKVQGLPFTAESQRMLATKA